jgi:hypothetical protein
MRRVVVVLVLALVGAGFAGRLVGSNAVRAGATSISATAFRAELSVIGSSTAYACYLGDELQTSFTAKSNTISASGSAEWAKLQVEALAFEELLKTKYHWSPSKADLARARSGLLNDYTTSESTAVSSGSAPCTPSAAQAFAQLPKWFQDREVLRNAASLALLKKIGTVTPLTLAGLESFFSAHQNFYDTTCISIAYVPSSEYSAFEQARTSGASVATLARTFSADATSAKKGGAFGCFTPSSQAYASVRRFVLGVPLNEFSPRYQPQQGASGVYLLYVAATKRTASTFAQSESQVVSDVQSENSTSAADAERNFLKKSDIALDPAFGRWSHSKVNVLSPLVPSVKLVPNSAAGLTL